MPGPMWDADAEDDLDRIARNAADLIRSIAARSQDWSTVAGTDDVLAWHAALYAGCRVPRPGYVGHFRGDESVPELLDYEVGVGRRQHGDGYPERVGVWSADLAAQIPALITRIHAGIRQLDGALDPGRRPQTGEAVRAVVLLAARVHGEWIRLHPFANGNGRTARVWANYIALRYSLPAFVAVKPRPDDVAYVRAAHASMGRPPDFDGDHAPITAVFARMLLDALRI